MKHIPVLLSEVIKYLDPQPNENLIDATLGLGGHTEKILEKTSPRGKVLGIDWDEGNLTQAKNHLKKFKNRCQFFRDNFSNLSRIIEISKFKNIKGILLDLGLSTPQLENPIYGLSFKSEQPLDMRLDRNVKYQMSNVKATAAEIVNKYPEHKIADILYQYGNIRNSRWIARRIIRVRQKERIESTLQLVKIIGTNNPKVLAPIFQALRIEVNKELENLENILPQIVEILQKDGRLVIISYHSGEDRIVKNFFRKNAKEAKTLKILTKKPIMASLEEIKNNPRSRSAKLRAAERVR